MVMYTGKYNLPITRPVGEYFQRLVSRPDMNPTGIRTNECILWKQTLSVALKRACLTCFTAELSRTPSSSKVLGGTNAKDDGNQKKQGSEAKCNP